MCSTPPAIAMSAAPWETSPATVVTAVIAPAPMRSIAKPRTAPGRPALVAGLGGGRDSDLADALGRQVRVAPQQLPDHADDQVIGPGLRIDALRTGLAERRPHAVHEDHVSCPHWLALLVPATFPATAYP